MNEYKFENLEIGQKESFQVVITEKMVDSFRKLTGDVNPLHIDDGFAKEVGDGKFSRHISFGMLTASFYSTLAGVYLPGKYSLIHSIDIKFQKPVYAGEQLEIEGKIISKQEALKLIEIKAIIYNGQRNKVSQAKIRVILTK